MLYLQLVNLGTSWHLPGSKGFSGKTWQALMKDVGKTEGFKVGKSHGEIWVLQQLTSLEFGESTMGREVSAKGIIQVANDMNMD